MLITQAILAASLALLLGLPSLLLFLFDSLNTRVQGKRQVDQLTETGSVLLLPTSTLRLVLLLCVSLIITATNRQHTFEALSTQTSSPVTTFINLLIHVLEAPPTIKVVPEIVERVDILLGIVDITQHRHRLNFAESRFTFEDGHKFLEEIGIWVLRALYLLFCGDVLLEGLIVWVNGVELPAALWMRQNLRRLLDTFEEGIVVRLSRAGLLVGVVFEDFLSIWRESY